MSRADCFLPTCLRGRALTLPTAATRYAAETARQQVGFAKRLRDPVDGLNYHGYNEADAHWSCCKWGRANGWGMLGHAEALQSMQEWPEGYPDEEQNDQIRTVFKQHAAAAKATQAADGR